MSSVRMERMAEELRRELSDILLNRINDPRLGMVMVTRVDVSRDLSMARVFVSFMGDEDRQEQSLRVLAHAGPFVRGELGRHLRLRRVPELRFLADPGIQYSIRLQGILREMGFSDSEPGTGEPGDHQAAEE